MPDSDQITRLRARVAAVERQRINIDRDHRREAIAGIGNRLQKSQIPRRIVRQRDQIGCAGLRIGKRQPGEPKPVRGGIERDDPHRPALLRDKDARPLPLRLTRPAASRPRRPIRRQKGEPQRQETPVRERLPAHDPTPPASHDQPGRRADAKD